MKKSVEEWVGSVDRVNWKDLETAYGSAISESVNVPELLKRLVSTDPTVREQAWDGNGMNAMYSCLCHQGDVYAATVAAVPLLVSLLEAESDPQTQSRTLQFLSDVAGLSCSEFKDLTREWPDSEPMAANHALAAHSELLVALMPSLNSHNRARVVRLLGSCHTAAKIALPALQKSLDDDADQVVRASAVFSILSLGGKEAVPRVSKELESADALVRICAALALPIELGPQTPDHVLRVLVEAITAEKDLSDLYQEVPWAEDDLGAEAAGACTAIGRRGAAVALPLLFERFPSLDSLSAVSAARYILALAFGEGEPPFADQWPDVLRCLANSPNFWTFNVNAHEVLDDFNLRFAEDDDATRTELVRIANEFEEAADRDRKMAALLQRD